MQSAHKVSRSNSNTRCASLALGMESSDDDFYCNRTVESEVHLHDRSFPHASADKTKGAAPKNRAFFFQESISVD
jgi:hypothetical protein